jgi:hypothetical protein
MPTNPYFTGAATSPATSNSTPPPAPSPQPMSLQTSFAPPSSLSQPSPPQLDAPRLSHDEQSVHVKEEEQEDYDMETDPPNGAHLRKDSYFGTPKGASAEQDPKALPPISSFSSWQMPATLAQVPSSAGFGPILPNPSPLLKPATPGPQPATINGYDEQTVMMSPGSIHTMQPRVYSHGVPNGLQSIFSNTHEQERPKSSHLEFNNSHEHERPNSSHMEQ